MKQLEIKQGKVVCPIDNTEIPVKLCEGCSKCAESDKEDIILCQLSYDC